jgi:hypothetical protein
MMFRKTFALLAVATLVILFEATRGATAQGGSADLSPDIMAFIGRRASCQEWSSKLATSSEPWQIDSVMRFLKCSDVADDERALRGKYASDSKILDALDATWVKVVKRVPARLPPQNAR